MIYLGVGGCPYPTCRRRDRRRRGGRGPNYSRGSEMWEEAFCQGSRIPSPGFNTVSPIKCPLVRQEGTSSFWSMDNCTPPWRQTGRNGVAGRGKCTRQSVREEQLSLGQVLMACKADAALRRCRIKTTGGSACDLFSMAL
jgi:hypothetical protein